MSNDNEQSADILAFPSGEKVEPADTPSSEPQPLITQVPEGLEPSTQPNLSVVPDMITSADVPGNESSALETIREVPTPLIDSVPTSEPKQVSLEEAVPMITSEDVPVEADNSVSVPNPERIITPDQIPDSRIDDQAV